MNSEMTKKLILSLQQNSCLYWDGAHLKNEDGNNFDGNLGKANWNIEKNLVLGKCGELYAGYVMSELGFDVYESLVDDHGVDMIAVSDHGDCLKLQVKTVRNSYTFIEKGIVDNQDLFEDYYVLYNRILPDSYVIKTYLFPMNHIRSMLGIVEEKETDIVHYMNFSYHPYVNGKSKPEYGISPSEKYYNAYEKDNPLNAEFFCIAEDWNVCDVQRVRDIIQRNKNL